MPTKTRRSEGKSLHAQAIDKHTWYYENDRSITVIHHTCDNQGAYLATDQFRIPYSKLIKSMNRCGALPATKRNHARG